MRKYAKSLVIRNGRKLIVRNERNLEKSRINQIGNTNLNHLLFKQHNRIIIEEDET